MNHTDMRTQMGGVNHTAPTDERDRAMAALRNAEHIEHRACNSINQTHVNISNRTGIPVGKIIRSSCGGPPLPPSHWKAMVAAYGTVAIGGAA